jgi:multimeric flavodoxin WrbA
MKVLGIVGSPRQGGNTEILVEEALAAAREAGAKTEIVLLADKQIAPCDACRSCVKTGACKINDDMQPIYKQMEAADALLLGSPVYFGYVTAQMKALIDRTYLFLRDFNLRGKVAAPILALRKVGAGQTRSQLYAYIVYQGMIPIRGAAGYGRQKGDVRTGEGSGFNVSAIEEARSTGKQIVKMVKRLA